MLLATACWPLPFDVYLLSFAKGVSIPTHTDRAPAGKRHYRFNIFLRQPKRGGQFVSTGCILSGWRFNVFRPDITPHSVSKIEQGSRLVLSIGWLWPERSVG